MKKPFPVFVVDCFGGFDARRSSMQEKLLHFDVIPYGLTGKVSGHVSAINLPQGSCPASRVRIELCIQYTLL